MFFFEITDTHLHQSFLFQKITKDVDHAPNIAIGVLPVGTHALIACDFQCFHDIGPLPNGFVI